MSRWARIKAGALDLFAAVFYIVCRECNRTRWGWQRCPCRKGRP